MGEGFFLSCSRHRVDVGSAAVSSCIALERVGGERLGLVVDVEACGGELGREFSPAQSAQGAELDVDSVERALRCFELVDPELGAFVLELGDAAAVVLSAGEVELARPDQDPVVHAIPPNAPACAVGEPLVETLGLLRLRELVEHDVAGGIEDAGCPDYGPQRLDVQRAVRIELLWDLDDEGAVAVLELQPNGRGGVGLPRGRSASPSRRRRRRAATVRRGWLATNARCACSRSRSLVRACRFLRLEFADGAGVAGALEEVKL